jgi:hypothetical protein
MTSMQRKRIISRTCLALAMSVASVTSSSTAADFDTFLKPLVAASCVKCHGGKEIEGEVNLKQITSEKHLLDNPKLIAEMINAIDGNEMPPEDEPALREQDRTKMLATLKSMLQKAVSAQGVQQSQIRRLNRFQYNNSVRDLFQLKLNVFWLPEKLITRHSNHLTSPSGKMADRVDVSCSWMNPTAGLKEVRAFPKDLRASHGFDNQANQLTLSPLLLDAFLKLSVSIVDSPDFNEGTVGIWSDFFQVPTVGTDLKKEVCSRLATFLNVAFRRPISEATLGQYTSYTMSKMKQGLSFTDSMKKAASAALSSPLFLYRSSPTSDQMKPFALASKLSYFLWSSGPDRELLQLAESGELAKRDVLNKTIDRMLADAKIERFMDTFPVQWLQLENIMAVTPDPQEFSIFTVDKNIPASFQMVAEPLLLFDAVFVEDRPVLELIAPQFSYQSDFLQAWYTTQLKPLPNRAEIVAENRVRSEKIKTLQAAVDMARSEFAAVNRTKAGLTIDKAVEAALARGQVAWEAAQRKGVAGHPVFSIWHRIGPFQADSFEEAHSKSFFDESKVDLRKTYGNQKWSAAKHFVDGKVHELTGPNSATYLYRTIKTESATTREIWLGSDDSFRVWLNGQLIAEEKVIRGVRPDQNKVRLNLTKGENRLLMKIANGAGGYAFYFNAKSTALPAEIGTALQIDRDQRTQQQQEIVASYYRLFAPELADARRKVAEKREALSQVVNLRQAELNKAPKPQDLATFKSPELRRFEVELRGKLRSKTYHRVPASDPRYGGVITNAAVLTMTSGPKRTKPISRGSWVIEVIFNDPPPPPPNDVPPLDEENGDKNQTIREKFAEHRQNKRCASCHTRIDPLGFALENFDSIGRWRENYDNHRKIDASGTLLRKYDFDGIVEFKSALIKEERRFAKAFTGHLLRFALSRELSLGDSLTVDSIVKKTAPDNFKLKSIIREVILSKSFSGTRN